MISPYFTRMEIFRNHNQAVAFSKLGGPKLFFEPKDEVFSGPDVAMKKGGSWVQFRASKRG